MRKRLSSNSNLCEKGKRSGLQFKNKRDELLFSVIVGQPRKRGVVHVENPRDYIDVPECDVVIAINVHPDVLVELPEIGCFKALIVPACNQNWCLPGLRRQLNEKCEEVGVDFASPKPFCNFESKGLIKKFCEEFKIGKPEFKVKVDGNKIVKAEVVVSDPCGSAYFVARRMRGYIIQDFQEFSFIAACLFKTFEHHFSIFLRYRRGYFFY